MCLQGWASARRPGVWVRALVLPRERLGPSCGPSLSLLAMGSR
jgi:hypothetical protein